MIKRITLTLLVFLVRFIYVQGLTIESEHNFYGKSAGTTTFLAESNYTARNIYYTPDVFYNSSFLDAVPVLDPRGIYIRHGDFVSSDLYHESTYNQYNMFSIWIYYVQGDLGKFVDLDWKFVTKNGSFSLTSFNNGTDYRITISMNGITYDFGKFTYGWNYILFGGSYQLFAVNMGNIGNGFDKANPLTINYTTSTGYFTSNRELGGRSGSDTTVEYIIYSLGLYQNSINYDHPSVYNFYGPTNSFYGTSYTGGDGAMDPGEGCDDSNTNSGDGGNSVGSIEENYTCTGFPSTCLPPEIGGDGIKVNTADSSFGDDGNTISNDGCSSACSIETGYTCIGGDLTRSDIGYPIGGDGYLVSSEECDDGNINDNDGCSSLCTLESDFTGATNILNYPASVCSEIGGDGHKYTLDCDDGNSNSNDGCSSSCSIEPGYQCYGGSSNSPDIGSIVCGDGFNTGFNSTSGDDGNTISGDGCSSSCKIESGYTGTSASPSVGTEVGGDGKRISSFGGDDGNLIDGDGCSSNCVIETGFVCSGGTSTKKDTCYEICGDGKDYQYNEGEDGNNLDNDGCSSTGEYESCYQCFGGTISSVDTGSILHITASILSSSNDHVLIEFDSPMQMNDISKSDMSLQIESQYSLSFDWNAAYNNSNTLSITLSFNRILNGNEILTIKFTNYKTFRGTYGGGVINTLSVSLDSSLQSSIASAKSIGNITQYLILIGIMSAIMLIMLFGGSLEMVWSLINTLQLIAFLPLMTPYYPEHVKAMFNILDFVNLDVPFFSSFFKFLMIIDEIEAPPYNQRFIDNGIDSPIFLTNGSSILMSLMFTILSLLTLAILLKLCKVESVKYALSKLVSSYFYNNFLRFLAEGYLELTFGAVLNLAAFPIKNIPEILSLSISTFFVIIGVVFPFMTGALLYDKRKQIQDENEDLILKYGTMYDGFRVDKTWYHFQYYSIFLLRRLIFVILLILLIPYPEIQCNGFILISFMTFSYQICGRPFKDQVSNLIVCINEGLLCGISIIQVIFITDQTDYDTINITGWVLISIMITLVIFNFIIVIPYTIKMKCAKIKSNKKQNDGHIDPIVIINNDTTTSATTSMREIPVNRAFGKVRKIHSTFKITAKRNNGEVLF